MQGKSQMYNLELTKDELDVLRNILWVDKEGWCVMDAIVGEKMYADHADSVYEKVKALRVSDSLDWEAKG